MGVELNRQWRLRARPRGPIRESDFELVECPLPSPGEGEVLVRTLYLSLDPAMRGWIEDRPSYLPPVGIGEVMRAGGVGQVLASRHPDLGIGDFVQGMLGWQEYALGRGGGPWGLARLPRGASLTAPLGVLGITGLSAYFGLLELGRPRPGETVVVSGAAGATGSIAGQIARIHGARVIGIAGGPEKCRWLREEARFDEAIDYRAGDLPARLRELCPRGVDVFFDNVGGPILDAVLARIAPRARIVLCGGISSYNETTLPPGPRHLMNLIHQRARMEGFIVVDYAARFGEGVEQLAAWLARRELVHREDVQHGIENAPRTLLRLFEGKNFGKQLLKLADPPLGGSP